MGLTRKRVGWVLDLDIRDFFTSLDHGRVEEMLGHRIGDKRVLRLIQKWLRAGVVEEGVETASEQGSPQGATISPLLANVYLHYVLDIWANAWRQEQARGEMIIVRYADDAVVGFQHRAEAERFLVALIERCKEYGLELHPEKTRLLEFGRFAAENRKRRGEGKPETFDFLGFTHICGKTRKTGRFMVKRLPVSRRVRGKLQDIKAKLVKMMHTSIPSQGQWLRSVIRGYYGYFAVPGTSYVITTFRTQVIRTWFWILRRRSQKTRINWERMNRYVDSWLPPARIQYPYPNQRFDARTQGRSPVR
ncbi:MAG: reverse transcriptase domain-containing protein [Candidatus Dormibacteraceae bacterium]